MYAVEYLDHAGRRWPAVVFRELGRAERLANDLCSRFSVALVEVRRLGRINALVTLAMARRECSPPACSG